MKQQKSKETVSDYKTHILGRFNKMLHVPFKKKILIAFCVYALLQISYLFLIRNSLSVVLSNSTRDAHFPQQKITQPFKYNPLFYVPPSTVSLWNERDFLVVFGIPSLDIPKRRWRRHMQRSTCWQFPGVATWDNNYTGAMLVLYLLARHPLNNFVISDAVVHEANQWRDVLVSPLNEGLSNTNKIKDGKGSWGSEAEIGSSRKTFLWFQMALLIFPRVPYLAKGDDDVFLRVPQYLADLRRLPLNQTYWGRSVWKKALKSKNGDRKHGERTKPFMFMVGPCYTMTRDIAEQITSYEPLRKIVWVPYRKERFLDFRFLSMDGEDVMVARILYEIKYPTIYVSDTIDRFHSYPNLPVTDSVVVVHAPKEKEYYTFMAQFILNNTTTPNTVIVKKSDVLLRILPPKKQKLLVVRN